MACLSPAKHSKWFALVRAIARGEDVTCARSGKEVHAANVARATRILLTAAEIASEAFNCYDRYVSEHEVAMLAKSLSGSRSAIDGVAPQPKNQIITDKPRALGMTFGAQPLLKQTVRELLVAV